MATRFLTRAEIESRQLSQLRALLAALGPNRFWQEKLARAGLGPEPIETLQEFHRALPFTTKREIVEDQLAHPPNGTNLTFPPDHYTRFHQTSGTTGAPLRWLDTPQSWSWMVESWREIFLAAGASRTDRVYFAFSFGPFIGFWLAFDAAQKLGCLCLPGGGLSTEARLAAIIDNGATILCCTPTYALRLGEVAAQSGIDLTQSRIRTIIVAGEPGGSIPSTRKHIEQSWPGARVFDHHGMTEVGPVTFECPRSPGVLHVIETAYLPEVIHPETGQAITTGTGELVLTTLGRLGSPLLRYRTGDLVKVAAGADPCPCGRSELALQGGILGRADDMVIVRGVNIHASAVESILRGFEEIAEFQVRVVREASLAQISLCIEPRPASAGSADLAGRVEKALYNAFSLRMAVTVVQPGALPRFEMKARRWQGE